MKFGANSIFRDFVPTLVCTVVVTLGMAWWTWGLKPYLDVYIGLLLALLAPWLGAFIFYTAVKRIRPEWLPFPRAFLTSVSGMMLFFLVFGALVSLVETGVVELRYARGLNITSAWNLYYSYQGERGLVGGTASLGEGLRGLWFNTLISWGIGLISSVIWLPALAILNLVWAFGWRGAVRVFWQSIRAYHSIQGQENEKIATWLDSIPIMVVVLLLLLGACMDSFFSSTYLDFAIVGCVFSMLPWGLGLMTCIVVRKRFAGGRRWLRSFFAAAYAFLFWLVTMGPRLALAEEATHQLRLICGTHRVEKLWDGPWCFYNDGDEAMGSGLAGIQGDTLLFFQGIYIFAPVGLTILLFLCFLNDYLIRLCQFTSKTDSYELPRQTVAHDLAP